MQVLLMLLSKISGENFPCPLLRFVWTISVQCINKLTDSSLDRKHGLFIDDSVAGYYFFRYFEMLFPKIFSEYSKEAKILLLSALLEVCCSLVPL